MQETGTLDKLWKDIERRMKRNDNGAKIREDIVLGYENVALPFYALLIGVCTAVLLLGMEGAIFCKKRYADGADNSNDDTLADTANIQVEINELLLELKKQKWFHEWCMKRLRERKIKTITPKK